MFKVSEYDRIANEIRRPGIESANGRLDVKELIRHATLAASSHNSQPWRFHIQQNLITILPDYARRCFVVDADDSHLFESLGCAAENLSHAAAAQGFSVDVQFDHQHEHIKVRLTRDRSMRATDLYRAIVIRQCSRSRYDAAPVGAAEINQLVDAGKSRHHRICLLRSDAAGDQDQRAGGLAQSPKKLPENSLK